MTNAKRPLHSERVAAPHGESIGWDVRRNSSHPEPSEGAAPHRVRRGVFRRDGQGGARRVFRGQSAQAHAQDRGLQLVEPAVGPHHIAYEAFAPAVLAQLADAFA